jgi:glycolate oxidase FAD binding subunit
MDNAQVAADWMASREQTLPFFTAPSDDACLWRLSLPQTAPVIDVPYAQYIEWQGAQRWLWAPASAATALREAAQREGGHATLFRQSADRQASLAMAQAVPVFSPMSETLQRIQRNLQQQFDPHGVFATGRMGA